MPLLKEHVPCQGDRNEYAWRGFLEAAVAAEEKSSAELLRFRPDVARVEFGTIMCPVCLQKVGPAAPSFTENLTYPGDEISIPNGTSAPVRLDPLGRLMDPTFH